MDRAVLYNGNYDPDHRVIVNTVLRLCDPFKYYPHVYE
jgi:hypothetical protein